MATVIYDYNGDKGITNYNEDEALYNLSVCNDYNIDVIDGDYMIAIKPEIN